VKHLGIRPLQALILGVSIGFGLLALEFAWGQGVPSRVATPARAMSVQNALTSSVKPRILFATRSGISELLQAPAQVDLDASMPARRSFAWGVVRSVWSPVSYGGRGYMPAWITWYQQEDIARLYRDSKLNPLGHSPITLQRAMVNRTSDLQASLTSDRLGRMLRQFQFPEVRALRPIRTLSAGTIFYSPELVQHWLTNAASIAACDLNPQPVNRKPNVAERFRVVRDPNNIYALCMEHEQPSSAVMIKASWVPLPNGPDQTRLPEWNLGTPAFPNGLAQSPAGEWALLYNRAFHGEGFTITDEHGRPWALQSMHIASKLRRTWVWISLWWSHNQQEFGADQPSAVSQEWPFMRFYKMCVASGFLERDRTPWAAWVRHLGPDNSDEVQRVNYQIDSLAEAIQQSTAAMGGAQWCANPNIETQMQRGNCIGCHQGSPTRALPTTYRQQYNSNLSDFSFSFATVQQIIRKVDQEFEALQQRKLRELSPHRVSPLPGH
jgi:hypothetical protein